VLILTPDNTSGAAIRVLGILSTACVKKTGQPDDRVIVNGYRRV
jgi:hypothetical protein